MINAGFKIALAINMLQSPNLITGSSLGPYGMIATAALSLMQSSQEESETRSILKGLRQLSEQINNLHKTVIEGFSRIDNHLFGMEIRIIEQLTKILKQNHNISVALGELEVELTKLREENKLIHIQELEAKRESLYLEFTNLVQECSKGFKKYSSCVEDFISTLNQFNNRENANFIGSKIPLIQNDKLSGNFPTHLAHFTKQINYYFDAGLKTPLHPNFYEYMRSNIILYLTKNLNYEKTERVDYLHFLLNRFDQRQESFFRELVVTNTDILVEQYINEYLKTIAQIEKGYLKMKDTFDQTVSAEIFQSERINSQNKGSFTQMLRSADGNLKNGSVSSINSEVATRLSGMVLDNYKAATKRDHFEIGIDDEVPLGSLWISPCSEASTYPAFAVERKEIAHLLGKDITRLDALSNKHLSICYNVNTKKEQRHIYIPENELRVTMENSIHLIRLSFTVNISLEKNQRMHSFTRTFSAPHGQFFYCKSRGTEPYDLFAMKNIKMDFNLSKDHCPTLKESLLRLLANFSNGQDFKNFKQRNIKTIKENLTNLVAKRKDYIRKLILEQIKPNPKLDTLAYLIKSKEYFTSELNKVPEWVYESQYFPTIEVIKSILTLGIQYGQSYQNLLKSVGINPTSCPLNIRPQTFYPEDFKWDKNKGLSPLSCNYYPLF